MGGTERINEMIRQGESLTVEFKSTFDRETIETLVAFANTEGGTVLVGVADDGAVRGVTVGKETLNDWLGQVKSATSPSIIPDIPSPSWPRTTINRKPATSCSPKPST